MKEKIKNKSKSVKTKKTGSKTVNKDNLNKKNLIKQLNNLVKEVDEDGIVFLIKQAQVFIYNKKVDEHNTELKKGIKIKIKKPPFSDKTGMEIKEADDGSSFIFVINRARKFFTLEEMRKIVNICNSSGNEKEASRRLFTWFKSNRSDVLIDVGIEISLDPALCTIYHYIIKRYKVKGSK
ncbi:MAG: hypothetical protein V1874_03135 [Spirochaetota bacterium]